MGRPKKPASKRAVRVSISLKPETAARVKAAAVAADENVSRFIDLTLRRALAPEAAA